MSEPLIFEVEVDARAAGIQIETPHVTVIAPSDPRVIFAVAPGPQGEVGPPGQGVQIFGAPVSGVQNGGNKTFTLQSPFRPNSTAVFLNGLREDNYTESGTTQIVFEDAPSASDKIRVDYILQG